MDTASERGSDYGVYWRHLNCQGYEGESLHHTPCVLTLTAVAVSCISHMRQSLCGSDGLCKFASDVQADSSVFLLQAYQAKELLAMKVFDANNVVVTTSFADELRAYGALHDLQGHTIPLLHSFGWMCHTGCPATATRWAGHKLNSLRHEHLATAVEGLRATHNMHVSHGDVRLRNMLVHKDRVVFCDLGQSTTEATPGDCQQDIAMLEELSD